MIGAGAVGFLSLQHGFSVPNDVGSLAEGRVLLPVGLLFLIGAGVLINQTKRTGTDKYLSQRRFIQLFLMPIDLIRGHVASVEGSTTTTGYENNAERKRQLQRTGSRYTLYPDC
jgi:hypothetical protein